MKIALIVLALCCTIPAHARGFLMWQAQKDDRVIHLLAAVPFLSKDVATDLAPEITTAFNESKLIVFESDPDPERRRAGRQRIYEAALYPENDSLINHLPGPVKKDYQKLCRDLVISGENINRLQPWMAAQNLLRIAMVKSQVRLADDLDRLLHQRAMLDDKPLAFLNTAQETLDMYQGMSEELAGRIFAKALRDAGTLTNFLPAVEAAWRASDLETATRLIDESFAGFDDVHAALFAERNLAWANDLDAQSGIEGEIFAVVSLSHLVGADNLLDRLAAMGYRIAQVVPE